MTASSTLTRFQDRLLGYSGAAFGIIGIAFIWIALVFTLHLAKQTALESAKSDTANLARAFEEQITREIKAVDQSLMFVRDSYARDKEAFDVSTWTRSAAAVTDHAIQLTIVDRFGFVKSTGAAASGPPIDLSDREHIRVHLNSNKDELFISKPVIGRVSHRWSIQFTRKLFDAKGDFDGVAVVSVDPTYLTRLYASIDLGKTGAVTLFGTDGVVRAAARVDKQFEMEIIGRQVSINSIDAYNAMNKSFVSPVDFSGIRRITSFRPINHYPLIVGVGLGEQELLADHTLMSKIGYAVALVLTVFLLIAVFAILLHQRRHAVARDRLKVSEQLYSEKSLILETALEHINQGIIMIGGDRRLQVCNHNALTLLELPEHLAAKGTAFDDIVKHKWQNGDFGNASTPGSKLPEFVRAGYIPDSPEMYECLRPNGKTLEIHTMPLSDGGMVRTYTDISARKAFEENLRTARDLANSAAKAKSEFLATMSHEIRSPLSGLVGALELLRATSLEADQAHMADLAHNSARNLLAILNDILDFSKIEAGALTLSVEPVEVQTLIEELAEPHKLMARSQSVTLTTSLSPDVPLHILTDRLRLGQIITNLLSNAVKFTPIGAINLVVRLEEVDGTSMLRIDVSDTGFGMDDNMLTRLFQPFTQADGSSTRLAGGTGLGLSISRKLAHILDGTLDVVSQIGIGGCFTLRLKCIAHDVALTPAPVTFVPELGKVLVGLHILVVDDNPTNQWLTRRQLTTLGAQVETASSGYSALEALARSSFDAIITDCHMPGMDGVALTRAVRSSDGPERDCPIIGLTADVTPEQASLCHEVGMNTILYKPVSQTRLSQVLTNCTPQLIAEPDITPVFDCTTCCDLFDTGDPEMADWLRDYCRRAQTQVGVLNELLEASPLDRAMVASVAHQLVGASLSVGAMRFAHAVRLLEHAAPVQPERSLLDLIASIEGERHGAFAAIEAFLVDEPALL